jgi:hypothetical protein
MDRALSLARRASAAHWLAGILAALPLAAASLLIYDLQRVEGVDTPLWPFGVLFAVAYWARFVLLSRLARQFVEVLSPGLLVTAQPPNPLTVASTAAIAGAGLCLWALPLLLLGRLSVVAMIAALPVLCLRGAASPSLLARSACMTEQGWRAWSSAREDTRGARPLMVGLSFLAILCLLLLFANLYACGAFFLLLANAVLGLDVGVLGAFLSSDNDFVLLLLLGCAALLFEPLQAAVSAVAFCEARRRKEGADLHVAIDALATVPSERAGRESRARAKALLGLGLGLGLASVPVHAEPGPDDAIRVHVQQILLRQEFHDFESSSKVLPTSSWLERSLHPREEPVNTEMHAAQFQLRLPATFVVLLSLILLIAVIVYVSREARRSIGLVTGGPIGPSPASLRPPTAALSIDQQLAAARAAAEAGQYSLALRQLYGVCLFLLARIHALPLDAARTNGEYLRMLSKSPLRAVFERLTVLFERSCYGRVAASAQDYEELRRFAEALREPERGA